ncbi:MAG: SufD family Fe-S cluster assembly protein, partial [Alphaproteobacteria bacterium]
MATNAPARPARRAPGDLPFRFAYRGLVQALAAERDEPAWLRAERLNASKAFEALPVEGNQLYTTYVDLRNASLETVKPFVRTAVASAGLSAEVPEGVAGIIEIVEDGIGSVGLSKAAADAGVVLETLGAALARDPKRLRAELEGGASLPSDDKLAALARGFWSQGIRLGVPVGVRLADPILIRWRSSRPDRALITRTMIALGDGASASVVEELEPSGAAVACAEGETVPQGLFHGTTEVTLGRDANLAFASIQDLPLGQVSFSHRSATIGAGSALHWALAQLGSRLVRSRVDNRLEGDRSSVEQVEIVFGAEDQLFDLTSYTKHVGRDTTGNLLSKGALLD